LRKKGKERNETHIAPRRAEDWPSIGYQLMMMARPDGDSSNERDRRKVSIGRITSKRGFTELRESGDEGRGRPDDGPITLLVTSRDTRLIPTDF